ncbi:MAG: hydrogenase maturation nickel metallochaperone HypA/HybF [Promethearchaeota archaeon]
MHEFSLAQNIFDVCIQSAKYYNAKRILDIYLEIGDFTLVIEDFLKQCFEIVSKNSIAEGANLHIKKTPGLLLCYDCGEKSQIWFNEEKKKEEEEQKNKANQLDKENQKRINKSNNKKKHENNEEHEANGEDGADNEDNVDDEGRVDDELESQLKKYEEQVASISSVKGYQYLGINLFRCRKCGSRNTELMGGKEIKVKNIKVTD